MKRPFIFVLLCCLLSGALLSQRNKYIVDILRRLSQTKEDTARLGLYLDVASEYASYKNDSTIYYCSLADALLQKYPNLARETDSKYLRGLAYYTSSDFQKAQISVNEALMVCRGTNDKAMMAKCYNILGAIEFTYGNYSKALSHYNNKLAIVVTLDDTLSIIETHYNISLINNAEGSYYRSLEHNYAALHLAEKTRDTVSMMIASEGLGIAYTRIEDEKNAILYLKRALHYSIRFKRYYEQSGIMVDLGNVYRLMGEYEKALYYYQRGQEISARNGDRLISSIAITGKGETYIYLKKFSEAIPLFARALDICREVNYPKGQAENNLLMAECYLQLNSYKDAKKLSYNALGVLKDLKEPQLDEKAYSILSKAYDRTGNTDSAFICFKKQTVIADTLAKKAALVKITEYEATLEKEKIEQERSFGQQMARAELLRQKQIRNTILAASGLILLLLVLAYRNFRLTQKAYIEIEEQKKTIEHKNKDILDSISYSKRLQDAALSAYAEIRRLLPSSFVIYEPAGSVSSDFYFVEEGQEREIHVGLASCAGSGVPGAFMTIVGQNILKQAFKQGLRNPREMLDLCSRELRHFLRTGQQGSVSESINISYGIMDHRSGRFDLTCANSQAWIVSAAGIETPTDKPYISVKNTAGRIIHRLEPNGAPVGAGESLSAPVTCSVQLQKGDSVYLFSRPVKEEKIAALESIVSGHENMEQRKEFIKQLFSSEPGNDVCIIGFGI